MVFLLICIDGGEDVSVIESVQIQAIIKLMERKGLISGDKITIQGKELIEFVNSSVKTKLVRKKIENESFDEFWKLFPGTDVFEYKGKKFSGARSLRTNKEECKVLFNKILNEGEYSAIQVIEALKYDVAQKKEQSYKQGANKLTFMQNSATYLRQKSFEPFISLLQEGTQESEIFDGVNI